MHHRNTKKTDGNNFSTAPFKEPVTTVSSVINTIISVFILILLGLLIVGVLTFGIWTLVKVYQIPTEPIETEADALKKTCQVYCDDTCSDATDCPALSFRDLRFLLTFNDNSYSIFAEKVCIIGRCFYNYVGRFPGNNDTYAAFGWSSLWTDFFNIDTEDTNTFTFIDANETSSLSLGGWPLGTGDETPANWEIDQFCMGLLHPVQTNVLFDCIIPHLLRLNDDIRIECLFTFDCKINISTYLTSNVLDAPAYVI